MEIVKRLALMIHWIGFLLGSFFFLGFMIGGFFVDGLEDSVTAFLAAPVMLVLFAGIGWLIRFILVGKINFYPWR